jgi:hypothetical protein
LPVASGGAAGGPRYGCVAEPTHLASAPSQYGHTVPYESFIGGVLQMSGRG